MHHPVQRRAECRRSGAPSFRIAWPVAVHQAVSGSDERVEWLRIFGETRWAWAASYSRRPWPVNLRPALSLELSESESGERSRVQVVS